ncbi:phosphatidylinositol-specific phospholipase C [Clostridium sp. UBA6640]|uniref:phosphatidylinositol-specific phospholipase C n=1 Tax=Clostridium sp. UBA6640 TaxID=1946370 RepID=UPI0025B80A9F|nr:phosphatidylinositol-specific phospholipase C [Clostridium sp. UBA6640]
MKKIKPIILTSVLFLLLTSKIAIAHDHSGYSHDKSIGYENQNWMSKIDGSTKLSQLSIPGTHDTMSLYGGDSVQTQSMNLETQLKSGIRYLDIRCRYINETVFSIHHGFVYQEAMFGDVLNETIDFLRRNPSETILMRVKQEYSSVSDSEFNDTFKSYVNRYNDWFWDNNGNNMQNPTLDEIRGKIVVLYDVGGLNFGLSYHRKLNRQDDYHVSTNWDLYSKWESVRDHLEKANASPKNDEIYLNYLSASGGSFPYFIASGHSSSGTGAPRLATGLTTPGWKNKYPDFPRVNCFIGICTIAFEGTNILTTDRINNSKYTRVGILAADFPGRGLIDSTIRLNDIYKY